LLFEIDLARTLIAIITLGYAAYTDIKTREITPWLWLVASLVSLPLTAYEAWFLISRGYSLFCLLEIVMALIALPFIFYLFRKGLFGGADMLAYIFLTVDMPWYPIAFGLRSIMPIPLLTLLYASLLVALFIPVKVIKNLSDKRFNEHAKEFGIKGLRKVRLASTATVMTVKEYLTKKFWYPLEVIEEEGNKVRRTLRPYFNVEEEYEDHQRMLKEMVDRGLIKEEDLIFVTYGIPFIVFMFLGFILALIIGDLPFRLLLAF